MSNNTNKLQKGVTCNDYYGDLYCSKCDLSVVNKINELSISPVKYFKNIDQSTNSIYVQYRTCLLYYFIN